MRAVLLAAGMGNRLRPLTEALPKCLAPIRGRPLLQYWLQSLADAGFERVLVNTHYLAEMVREFIEQSPFCDQVELVHEARLLGTGGTVAANAGFCQGADLLVAHADNLSLFDAAELMRAHGRRPGGTDITMMTFRTTDPRSCGIVVTDARGVMTEFHEKTDNPPGNLANAAVYVFSPSVIRVLQDMGGDIDLSTKIVPRYLGRTYCIENKRYHRDIGAVESWKAANLEYPGPALARLVPDPWPGILDRDVALRRIIADLLAAAGAPRHA